MLSSIIPKKRVKLTILSIFFNQNSSEFCLIFGRIEETIICFRNSLTFSNAVNLKGRQNMIEFIRAISLDISLSMSDTFM